MRIAYIATSEIPSTKANTIQVMKVCQALTQNGHSVLLYVPGWKQVGWDDLKAHYGITESFPISWLPSRPVFRRMDFTFNSLRKARREGVEAVYTRMLWVGWAARLFGIPAILEMHDLPTGRMGPRLYREYLGSNNKKLIIYITRALKDLTDRTLGVQARSGEWMIAPDGVDLERYEALPKPAEARWILDLSDQMTAAYSGGFYQGRGLETLLELARSFPQIQFLWIGGTTDQVEGWKSRLDSENIHNIVLTGFVANDKLPLFQAAADILLMPYGRQFSGSSGGNIAAVSSPMKMFEYMATARAILTSDIPVLREVLNESNASFYIPEDLEDLKHQFRVLLSDQDKQNKLAENARKDVEAFEWKTRMRKIMRVFNS
jgi:glycosyltransferase involved in cell wall biosynthesis